MCTLILWRLLIVFRMQLSLHFRGPLHLKQFGVYYPKTKAKRHTHQHGRRHHAHHRRVIEDCNEDTSYPGTPSPDTSGPDSWEQSAYYNAETQSAEGLIFLAHHGGEGCSGTWDKYDIYLLWFLLALH